MGDSLDKKEALLLKVQSHKRNVSPKEIIELLVAWGFYERKGRGDHRAYKHDSLPATRLTIPFKQKPFLEDIVKQVLKAIQELQEQEND
jgi:predicted RNA binding protein YcfA (HicA-like mRNA interferase family)